MAVAICGGIHTTSGCRSCSSEAVSRRGSSIQMADGVQGAEADVGRWVPLLSVRGEPPGQLHRGAIEGALDGQAGWASTVSHPGVCRLLRLPIWPAVTPPGLAVAVGGRQACACQARTPVLAEDSPFDVRYHGVPPLQRPHLDHRRSP